MARFYDSVSDSDLMRVERLLGKSGIVYTLAAMKDGSAVIKEIRVSEEDFAAAERVLLGTSHTNN